MFRCIFSGSLAVFAILILPIAGLAQSNSTTIAIFADRPMPDARWALLFAAIRSELAAGDPSLAPLSRLTSPESSPVLLRGDRIVPGLVVDRFLTVYLHGDCNTSPVTRPPMHLSPLHGPLGWVELVSDPSRPKRKTIEPFIHIECDLAARMLRAPSLRASSYESDQLMSTAIARILLHEWLHVATQNPHHSRTGIAKAEFSVADLLGHDPLRTYRLTDSAVLSLSPLHGK